MNLNEKPKWQFWIDRGGTFTDIISKNSGGKGLHAGGNGVDRRLRFLESMTVNVIAGHRKIPPYGLSGGESGALGENYVIHSDESVTDLGTKGQIEVSENDLFVLKTPGGGGFGKNHLT